MSIAPDSSGLDKIWMPAPSSGEPMTTGDIQGVWVMPDEEVEWHKTIMPDGSFRVHGYSILKKRVPELTEEQKKWSLDLLKGIRESESPER